jgi:allantoin racemase
MRLLIANPNTTGAITDLLAGAARAVASPGTAIKAVTGTFGAAVMGSRMEMTVGDHAALDLVAREAADCDAVIIGAGVDSGLRAIRQMLPVPVIGMTEAALHVACLTAGRFGLVASSSRIAVVLRELVAGYGLTERLAGIRWLGTEAGDIYAAPESAVASIAEAAGTLVSLDLAETVILVGAVMAGMPPRVQDHVPVPVLEGVTCAVPLAEALVRMRIRRPSTGSFAPPRGRVVTGLTEALTARFTR